MKDSLHITKKHIFIFIAIVIALCLIPLIWIDFANFDKYKFTEEYYKFILSSLQLICFGVGLSFVLNRVIEKKKQEQIALYLKKQKEDITTIQNCFVDQNSSGLAEALRNFKDRSVRLDEIDNDEKALLEKLDYKDNIKDEINYIIDNIEQKNMTEKLMQQACTKVVDFLNNYLKNREG